MKLLRLTWLSLAACVLFPVAVHAGLGDRLVKARLLADVTAIKPGQAFKLGVLLQIEPNWHIYWKNPGDSGLPTRVKLALPEGFSAGEWQFPVPMRIELPGEIINFAYENEVMLTVQVKPPTELALGASPSITAEVNFLICQEQCLPGKASAPLELPVSTESKVANANAELFEKWTRALPAGDAALSFRATPTFRFASEVGSAAPTGQATAVLKWITPPKSITWFPERPADARLKHLQIKTEQDITTITFDLSADKPVDMPKEVAGVLAYQLPDGTRRGVLFSVPILFSPGR